MFDTLLASKYIVLGNQETRDIGDAQQHINTGCSVDCHASLTAMLKALLLGVATLISCACTRAESPTVVLGDIGTVVGTTNATLGFDSFLGIPYVQPPVGPLRWRVPVPLTRDPSRVIHATAWGPACIQVPFGGPQLVRLCLMCALLR